MWDEQKFDASGSWATPLFFVNWFVNIIFMIDIAFNFFLPFREPIRHGGAMVKSHGRIARHYLRGWFTLDIISVIPIDNIMMGVDTSAIENPAIFSSIRMLRLLRLIKLTRILRASRIFSRWENSISLSYARQDLIRWVLVVAFLLYGLSCVLGMLAQLSSPPRTAELALAVEAAVTAGGAPACNGCLPGGPYGGGTLCGSPCLTACELRLLAQQASANGFEGEYEAQYERLRAGQSWVCRYAERGTVSLPTWHGEVWVAGLYVAMLQLGGGVGSIVPENFGEYVVFLIGIILGSITWAMCVCR